MFSSSFESSLMALQQNANCERWKEELNRIVLKESPDSGVLKWYEKNASIMLAMYFFTVFCFGSQHIGPTATEFEELLLFWLPCSPISLHVCLWVDAEVEQKKIMTSEHSYQKLYRCHKHGYQDISCQDVKKSVCQN